MIGYIFFCFLIQLSKWYQLPTYILTHDIGAVPISLDPKPLECLLNNINSANPWLVDFGDVHLVWCIPHFPDELSQIRIIWKFMAIQSIRQFIQWLREF